MRIPSLYLLRPRRAVLEPPLRVFSASLRAVLEPPLRVSSPSSAGRFSNRPYGCFLRLCGRFSNRPYGCFLRPRRAVLEPPLRVSSPSSAGRFSNRPYGCLLRPRQGGSRTAPTGVFSVLGRAVLEPPLRVFFCVFAGGSRTASAGFAGAVYSGSRVSTSAPLAVMATVSSKWADRLPSAVTTVQPSRSTAVSQPPMFSMGSMAIAIPLRSA